jgi:hypothetical protein
MVHRQQNIKCIYFCLMTEGNRDGRWQILNTVFMSGRDSTVSIATLYGLDGPGIESRWGNIFRTRLDRHLGSTQPPTQWVPGLSRGQSGRGVTLFTKPHLAPRLKKEYSYSSSPPLSVRGVLQVEFYLYLYLCLP